MRYDHVDVFSKTPLSGNGLIIFYAPTPLGEDLMQRITQEMRQFESIFLTKISDNSFRARIFTMEEELDYAGHPVLGAAASLHESFASDLKTSFWNFHLNKTMIEVKTVQELGFCMAEMNQGAPQFIKTLTESESISFLQAFNLKEADVYDLPLEVISTGLPYLILPVKSGVLKQCKIIVNDLESKLQSIGAKFAFVLDIEGKKGRTWDNLGLVEDIATGSSAGPVGAFFVKHGLAKCGETLIISQGEFVNRPSQIYVKITGSGHSIDTIYVSGAVCYVGHGGLTFPYEDKLVL